MPFKKSLGVGGVAALGAYLACCGGGPKPVVKERSPEIHSQRIDLSEVPGMSRVRMSVDFPRADSIFIGTLMRGEMEYEQETGNVSTRYFFSGVECAKFKKTQLERIGTLESITGASGISVLLPRVVDFNFYFLGARQGKGVEVLTAAVLGYREGAKLNVSVKDMKVRQGEKYIIFTKDGGNENHLSNIYPANDANKNVLEGVLKSYNRTK